MKIYTLCALSLICVTGYAADIDCKSADYSYNPTVQQACEDMQKITVDAKKQGDSRFADLIAQKRAAAAKALKSAAPAQTQGTIAPTQHSAAPAQHNPATENLNTAGPQPLTGTPSAPPLTAPAPEQAVAPKPNATTIESAPAPTPYTQPPISPNLTAPAQVPVPTAGDTSTTPANQTQPVAPAPNSVKYY